MRPIRPMPLRGRLAGISCGLAIISALFSQAVVWADVGITKPEVKQVDSDTVVVSWHTDVPSSSQVRYSSEALFGDQITPQYDTITTVHQLKINGLFTGDSYSFVAISFDNQGRKFTSDGTSIVIKPLDIPETSVSEPFANGQRIRFSLLQPFTAFHNYLRNNKKNALTQLQEAKIEASGRTPSHAPMAVALITALITILIFLLEEGSVWLLLDAFLLIPLVRLAKLRGHRHIFRIISGASNRPLYGAEVAIIRKENDEVVETYTTDVLGCVSFNWPLDKPVTVRVTRKGYQGRKVTFTTEVFDIMLTPLNDIINPSKLLAMDARFQLRHSLPAVQRTVLIIGSLFLLLAAITQLTLLVLVMAAIYGYLWVQHAIMHPKRYHLLQVVDTVQEKPIPHVKVTTFQGHRKRVYVTDEEGMVPIPFPMPEFISLDKRGYMSVLKQTIPMTAVSSEPLVFPLDPSH